MGFAGGLQMSELRSRVRGLFPLLLALGGCAPAVVETRPAVSVELTAEPEWHQVASPEDRDRIARINDAWTQALGEARAMGFRRAVLGEGELLDPKAALPRPAPSPGPYRCRLVRLGTHGSSKGRGASAFTAFQPFFCYVEADGPLLTIVKQTGSQRPAGWLYPDSDEKRLIFLGTLALGTEQAPMAYGEQHDRDMGGVIERVAPFRYRLVIPWPQTNSKLDVFELIPVTE
ncbi:MAG: hypothetical protein JWN69_1204 [Alphaproteobacteria bacterium]|nr:hypothetical protein [Alphaproteobacteria bacterium]